MNDYGKSQDDMAAPDEQAHELIDQLNLLEAVDRRITPEHVARRFRELLDDVGDDRLAEDKLGEGQAQAAEIVAGARRKAAAWLAKAERAANEVAVATQRARAIMADADAYADAQCRHAERMIADARRQAEEIIADAKKNAEQITSIAHATSRLSARPTTERQLQAADADADAEELTAAAELHIVLLPDDGTEGTVPADQTHFHSR